MRGLIVLGAKYLFLLPIFIYLYFLYFDWKENKNLLKLSLLSLPFSLILGKLSGFLIYDPRPFMVDKVAPLIAHASGNGFPSDHTLLAATLAAIVFTKNKTAGVIMFILSLFVGGFRILARVHHPEDILGSLIISIFAVSVSYLLLKALKVVTPGKH